MAPVLQQSPASLIHCYKSLRSLQLDSTNAPWLDLCISMMLTHKAMF